MSKRLMKKKNKKAQEQIEKITLEMDKLMDEYICSDAVYGDFELFSKISKLEKEKEHFMRLAQATSKNSKTADFDSSLGSNICIDDISFKLEDAAFKISYRENGRSYCEMIPICKNDMSKRSDVSEEIRENFGEEVLKGIDVNLYSALSKFDLEKETNYASDYANGDIDISVKYQFDNFYQVHASLSILDKMKVREMAKRNGYEPAAETKSKYLAPAIVSLAILVGAYGSTKCGDNNLGLSSFFAVEQDVSNGNDVELEDDSFEVKVIKAHTTTKVKDNDDVSVKNDDEKNNEMSGFKMKDKYYLDSVDLSISSVKDKPCVNTDKLDCDYYKVALVSVNDDKGIKECKSLDKMKNKDLADVVDSYIEKYGKDVSVSINFDGYDKELGKVYRNVGWADLVNINVSDNKTNKSKIRELKKLKNSLKENHSSKGKIKTYKKI